MCMFHSGLSGNYCRKYENTVLCWGLKYNPFLRVQNETCAYWVSLMEHICFEVQSRIQNSILHELCGIPGNCLKFCGIWGICQIGGRVTSLNWLKLKMFRKWFEHLIIPSPCSIFRIAVLFFKWFWAWGSWNHRNIWMLTQFGNPSSWKCWISSNFEDPI